MAMRRISWTDQRINGDEALWSSAVRFWGRRGIRVMPDRGHHDEGEHDERDMTMPAVPRAALVVVEAEFVLGRLETILDRPEVSFDLDQGFDACCVGTPGGEEGHIVIGDVAADQHTSCP